MEHLSEGEKRHSLTREQKDQSFQSQPRPQGFSLKKWHPFFKGKALGTRLFQSAMLNFPE